MLRFNTMESGDIKLGDRSINDIKLRSLREEISWIPQEPSIFTGTIRFNLDPFGQYSDEKLIEKMQLSGFSSSFENNNSETTLKMECKENGDNLSSGQKQLLSFTRALVRESKV